MRTLRLGCALAALMAVPTAVLAQSTGSQELEEIVVTASKRIPGIIVAESVPKQRATIGKDYIDSKAPGQSILDTLNLTPGLNFVNNDPYGNSGGNLRLRGLDGNRIALLQDGIPLNDSGNYAIFSNQQLDSELIERAVVNVGTTDVDSPTASSTGGTINYITIKPSKEFGGFVQGQYGENNYRRGIVLLNSGEFGPWHTSAFISGSYTKYDKFKGPGTLEKYQGNFRIFQPIGSSGDFVSVIGNYNHNRNNFYRNLRKSEFQANPNIDRVSFCPRPTPGAGIQDETLATFQPCGGTTIGVDSGYYNLFINPSNTGNIRAQGRFTLADGLILTVDPSYQYVLANGGGNEIVSEKDQRLQGTRFNPLTPVATQPGVDLNGDGDLLDRVRLYRPNNTNTNRYGINTSLIYEINDTNRVRVAYTRDDARHRQTGEFTYLDTNGDPTNVFGGRNGTKILTLDGTTFQTRNRKSVALLNQFAGEYRGQFFKDLVTVSLGVRAPFFRRELNQFCYTTTAGFAYCSAQAPATISAANNARGLFNAVVKYDKILPNVGISIEPAEGHMLFAGYSQNLSSPRTDDLYDVQIVNAQPETTTLFEAGYRYQRGPIIASVGGYTSKFNNRIVRAFDQDLGINIARNVGSVRFRGFDGQVGVEPFPGIELYGTYSYTDTELLNDLILGRNAAGVATVLPIKGKQLVETPRNQWGLRASYSGKMFNAGVELKRVGQRFATDVNDEIADAYTVVNLNARVKLDKLGLRGSYFQLNWSNVFDTKYLGNISSQSNATNIIASNGSTITGGFPTYSVGAPSTVQGALRIAF